MTSRPASFVEVMAHEKREKQEAGSVASASCTAMYLSLW